MPLEPNQTLSIPNADIQTPMGNLTLSVEENTNASILLRLNGGAEERVELNADNRIITRGVHDNSAVKNLGPSLVNWQFN